MTEPINDTAKFDSAPCTALTAAQLASIDKFADGKPGHGAGSNCDWEGARVAFTITAVTDSDGLSAVYQEKSNMGIFQPVDPIQGHPAVLYGVSNRLSKGQADLSVGINDHITYSVDVNVSNGPDMAQPDKLAEKIADLMITTMKSGK